MSGMMRWSAGRTLPVRTAGRCIVPLVLLLAGWGPAAAQSTGVTQVENRALVRYQDGSGRERQDTARAQLRVASSGGSPELGLEIEALVSGPLRVGDTLVYRITVTNRSQRLPVRNVVVTNELPAELSFVAADLPTVSAATALTQAGSTPPLRWQFAELAQGQSREIHVTTRIVEFAAGMITNRAVAEGHGVVEAVVAAAVVGLEPAAATLQVGMRASALEAGMADVVGYTIVVRNTGSAAVVNARLHNRIPTGLRLHNSSITGALLEATTSANTLVFALPPLAAGDSVAISYTGTVTAAHGSALRTDAWTVAADGAVSDTARAVVRVQGGAMATRAVLGRVWLDADGDGRQQADEAGVAHAVIWVSSGELVRTDAAGRFSLPDVAPGRYTLRVDPLSVPAGYLPADVASIRVDGWTTPSVGFGLRPDPTAPGTVVEAAPEPVRLPSGVLVPRPRIATPSNGAVLATDRVYVRVEGEPLARVQLYAGERLVAESVVRPDGVEDFIGVQLAAGPNVLEARVRGAAGEQRHAVTVHVTGEATRFVRSDTAQIRAGVPALIAVQVLDVWGVGVAQQPLLTVVASGMRLLAQDTDAHSYGVQVPVNAEGLALVPVRADSTGLARLVVRIGAAETSLPVTVLPEIRSLVVLADGEVGAGAATRSYGAIVARGAVDDRTAITVSYDSRRQGREGAFGGAYDLLAEGRYPTLGDASERTVLRGATTPLSLRVERDRSWLQFGDVDARDFGDARSLGHYRRALPGMTGRMVGSLASLTGFGSMVAQQLVRQQVRGNGSSGPYHIGGGVRLGTEQLAIETRDRLNASLVLARQELERFVDYDIDAVSGTILLRRPLPAADAAGNPLMLVVLAEQLAGDDAFVGGLRAELDLGRALHFHVDSMTAGAAYIEDRSLLGGHSLLSADARMARAWGGTRLELARGAAGDSTGLAFQAAAWLGAADGHSARIEWSRTGDGFHNPANPRLVAGTEDLRLTGTARLDRTWSLTGTHQQQTFRERGAERTQTLLGVLRRQGASRMSFDAGVQEETASLTGTTSSIRSALARAAWKTQRTAVWLEGSEPLSGGTSSRPRSLALGASREVIDGIRIEAGQRVLSTDSATWGVTSAGVRTEFGTGTRAWTQYDLSAGAGGYQSAALAGLGQKLQLGAGWAVDAMVERRAGLARLPETDPLRALPFAGLEEDRWSVAGGLEWRSQERDVRAALRGELHDRETTGRSHRLLATGDMALNPSWALLLRQDARSESRLLATGGDNSHASHGFAALAFRPADRSDWNGLFKLEWRSDRNPRGAGGAAARGTDERIIVATEAVWTPRSGSELGARYAMRVSSIAGELAGGHALGGEAHHVGGRARQALADRLDVRVLARLLAESRSGMRLWDVSPAVGYRLMQGLEVEAGHRFGNLVDRDFAPDGRRGFYVSLGMSLTELDGPRVADFWRQRLERETR